MGGKKNRIKGDLDDVEALLEIMNILKDVSTNRFFAFAQQKTDFSKFLEFFLYFFDKVEFVDTRCPLIKNDKEARDIVLITSDAGFMASLNNRVCLAGLREAEKLKDARICCVGERGVQKATQLGLKIDKIFRLAEEERFEGALMIRDYLVERVMSGETGGCTIIYTWPKSFNVLKPRVVKLLPAIELLGKDADEPVITDKREMAQIKKRKSFIYESSVDGIMKVISDLWIASRLFEILTDLKLAEAATQAQQLEQAVESLGTEKKALTISFKKASRDDLNKAMREVFASSSVIRRR